MFIKSPRLLGSLRRGQVCVVAAQCPPSPEQAGRELQHEGDGGLQGPPRQADHGENPNPKFQRASSHEQKERDGWSKSGEDAVPEVGRRVSWVAPASTSNSTGHLGDLKFPGRCGDIYSNRSQEVALGNMFTSFCSLPGRRYPALQ